jgi:hypothetical protein
MANETKETIYNFMMLKDSSSYLLSVIDRYVDPQLVAVVPNPLTTTFFILQKSRKKRGERLVAPIDMAPQMNHQ